MKTGSILRAEPFSPQDLRRDAFQGGKVMLWQPTRGYRAGVDPVLLAASIAAKPGQSVLELGCGAGPALACLGARVPGLRLGGIELQPAYVELARRNLQENGQEAEIWTGDLANPPSGLRQRSFDHVMANPPYFETARGLRAEDAGRDMGRAGDVPLVDWVQIAAKRCAPRGYVTFIQRAERLPELLDAFQAHLGAIELWPLLPREGRGPRLILLRGRKSGRAPFRFHPGLVLHSGARHESDAEDYSPQVLAVLRDGAALPFPA